MSVYGRYLAENSEFSTVDAEDIRESITSFKESYAEVCMLLVENEDYGYIDEGANIESMKALRDCREKFKPLTRTVKQNIKDGKKSEAKKNIAKLKELVKKSRKEAEKVPSDAGSAVLGYFTNCIVFYARNIGWVVAGLVIPGGAIALFIKSIIDFVNEIIGIIKDFEEGKSAADALNLWRQQIKLCFDKLDEAIAKLEQMVDRMD